jgi:hypothetical protein
LILLTLSLAVFVIIVDTTIVRLGPAATQLKAAASAAFFDGCAVGCLVAAGALLPAQPVPTVPSLDPPADRPTRSA